MLSDDFQVQDFNRKLKAWYLENHRRLPWRDTRDPYKIWLSEIILQQTRVAQGMPYYERFLLNYPTVRDLANAEEKDVLRLWQGLGYYSRARNMHYTARQVVSEYGGQFPASAAQLSKLKGLGTYTAAAVASFAFGEAVPAVDGNVYRVLSRIFGVFTDILSNEGKKEFYSLAEKLISHDDPATFNQAMIEFGALQCVPVSPKCETCPFNDICYAYFHQAQGKLPVKQKKSAAKQRYLHYIVIEQSGRLAMKERGGKDIWQGLYDFLLIESKVPDSNPDDWELDASLQQLFHSGLLQEIPKIYTHILTHQRLNVRFWRLEIQEESTVSLPGTLAFYSKEEVGALPKPILIDSFLKDEGLLFNFQ